MNICILQHVPFEGAGTILPFFERTRHRVRMVHIYDQEPLPSSKWPDFLIVMGGPMGVSDENKYPWLAEEKTFIKQVIQSGSWVLGVCLGAQLIANVLGAPVTKNKTPEIGWFPVELSPQINDTWLAGILQPKFEALHWHGDTFGIPEGAKLLGSSEACSNQGFLWQNRVLGLQFHLEFTPESTALLAEKCADELIDSPWVQATEQMLSPVRDFRGANACMAKILAHIETAIHEDVKLHPQLDEDSVLLAESNQLWVLLNKNAAVPWFILVPKGKYRDLDDLTPDQRNTLFFCADRLSDLLRSGFRAEKINIAALGNMVPQLHLHVIGRTSSDACWPNPVWGHLTETKSWTRENLDALRQKVKPLLD